MATLTWTGAGQAGNWSDSNNWFPKQVPGANDTVTINSAVTITTGLSLNNGTLTIQTTVPGSSISFSNTNMSGATVIVTGAVSAKFGSGDNIGNSTIKAQNGGTINLGPGGSPNLNSSTVEADAGSKINVNSPIQGNNMSVVLNGGTLYDNVSSNGNMNLFAQPLNGSTPIDLSGNSSSQIIYNGTPPSPSYAAYAVAIKGHNPNANQVPCFLPGTLIETSVGPVAVEDIRVGMRVVAYVDGVRTLRDVMWVGTQHAVSSSEEAYPVRIRKDAISNGVPSRDLLVTPEHCLFIDGVLIPARMLVNGRSIMSDRSIAAYDYYHIETNPHSIILAEGALTESYLDTGGHRSFHKLGNVVRLQGRVKDWSHDAAAPLATERAVVEPIFRRLKERAVEMGHQTVLMAPAVTIDPDLRLVTDKGRILCPLWLQNGRLFFDLPHRTDWVRVLSRTSRPSEVVGPFIDDRRELGVLIGEVAVRDQEGVRQTTQAHLAGALAGWYVPEAEACRWTDGDALLPLPASEGFGSLTLEIEIKAAGPYFLDEEKQGGQPLAASA